MTSRPRAEAKAKVIPMPFSKIKNQRLEKIAISTQGKIVIIHLNQIHYFKASGNYTEIYLGNNQSLLASITLKRFEEKLNPDKFLRIHQGYIVNSNYITAYLMNKNEVHLNDKVCIPVSRSKKQIINQFIKQITL